MGAEIRVAPEASARLEELHARRRGMLEAQLRRAAASLRSDGRGGSARLIQVHTPMDVAACEVVAGDLVVYAVVPKSELMQRLWGPELDRRLRLREARRLVHGRW
jgi:hypothetical protein